MISPWLIHRHEAHWPAPDRFDPDRFLPGREEAIVPGTYIPFGLGPRACIGATFALVEGALILARTLATADLVPLNAGQVRPVARLTTRPDPDIRVLARPPAPEDLP